MLDKNVGTSKIHFLGFFISKGLGDALHKRSNHTNTFYIMKKLAIGLVALCLLMGLLSFKSISESNNWSCSWQDSNGNNITINHVGSTTSMSMVTYDGLYTPPLYMPEGQGLLLCQINATSSQVDPH